MALSCSDRAVSRPKETNLTMCTVGDVAFSAVHDLHGVYADENLVDLLCMVVSRFGQDKLETFTFYHRGVRIDVRMSIDISYSAW